MKRLILLFVSALLILPATSLYAAELKLDARIEECTDLFDEVMQMPDKAIPEDLLSKCAGVAIFPSVLKGGFIIGGRYGKGVILRHDKKTGKWSAPAFYTIGGVSYGFQIGGQAIDLILVITSKRGMKSLLDDAITLGGDVAVSAGPVGRNAEAGTDLPLKAGMFSYSRSRGLFAGVAFKGGVIKQDVKSNNSYYKEGITVDEILFKGKARPTSKAKELIKVLQRHSR